MMRPIVCVAAVVALLALALVGCGPMREDTVSEFEFDFDFEESAQEWVAGFADLPADYDEDVFQLESSWQELPSGLEGRGIYMQGDNKSSDLFMFLKVQVEGLKPDTTYDATFAVDLATNIPEGMTGIGGSPGESVYVKAGATAVEPVAEEDDSGMLRMNIDKGNQATEGEDMINLGNIAYTPESTDDAGDWKIKPLDSEGQPFTVTSDGDGKAWLIVGTDSGFAGLTAVYYAQVSANLKQAGGNRLVRTSTSAIGAEVELLNCIDERKC